MSLPKKIAAMAASIAGLAFLLAVPVAAQNAPAATPPKGQVDFSTPTAEAPHSKVSAHRRAWVKKHEAGTASGTSRPPKPKATNKLK
jgi:hypothetical protein